MTSKKLSENPTHGPEATLFQLSPMMGRHYVHPVQKKIGGKSAMTQ
jgi:hypothetical protein